MAEIVDVEVSAFEVPTEKPESDGTAEWSKTTLVVVELQAAGERGLGYTYADLGAARIAHNLLAERVRGISPFDTRAIYRAACAAVRNHGRQGVCAMAISALDVAAWDLKARLLGVPLAKLLGQVRAEVPLYGSGAFTSYSERQLADQLSGWADHGFRSVKMKVG